jgi:asparaginyl-tRNA synthetase
MKENPADPRTCSVRRFAGAEGYGEIIGGSQREDDHDRLLARIKEEGSPARRLRLVTSISRKYGTFVHSGFGWGSSARRADLRNTAHSARRRRFRD